MWGKKVFICERHISAWLLAGLLAFAVPFSSDYDLLKWNDAIKSGFTIVFSLLRSSGHRISVGLLSRIDWLTCHPSPPVSLFLSASLSEYLWYTLILRPIISICVECLDWPTEANMLIIFQDLKMGYNRCQSTSCAPVTSHSHSCSHKLSVFPFLSFPLSPFSFDTLFLSIHLLHFYLDCYVRLGWWMCLISHLDLSNHQISNSLSILLVLFWHAPRNTHIHIHAYT